VETVSAFDSIPHPRIPLPVHLFQNQASLSTNRKNSMGANLANDNDLRALAEQRQRRHQQMPARGAPRRWCRAPTLSTGARCR
jgi:delta 1-pyrroline-5-carboxylate dehydrogenase